MWIGLRFRDYTKGNVTMDRETVVLAIDIGSSSVRAALFDAEGEQRGLCAQKHYRLDVDSDGKAAVGFVRLLRYTAGVIDEVLRGVPPKMTIAGVALSTFWHSLVGVDGRMRPTTPVMIWADRRASSMAAALTGVVDTRALHQQTGCPLHSSFWPARLRWLAKDDPAVFTSTRFWLSAADLFFYELFGVLCTSSSMASGTGLFDLNRICWNQLALDSAGIEENALPAVSDDPYRHLLPKYARRWPQLAQVPWFPAKGDGGCSNVGAGCVDDGHIVFMLGTSGSMRIVWQADQVAMADSGLWCFRIDRRYVAGGMALSEGGNAAAWARKTLALGNGKTLEARLAAMRPDAHGLTVLPYFLGARSPLWRDGRTAVFAGITAATTSLEMYRATLESVACRFAILKKRLDAARPGKRRIVATGGALLRSSVWSQMIADCLNEEVSISGIDEGSLRGAALLALESLEVLPSLGALGCPVAGSARPNHEAHERYVKAIERHDALDRLILSEHSRGE